MEIITHQDTSPPSRTNVAAWLMQATCELQAAQVPSASLDAQLLLAHSLEVNRPWLIAHSEVYLSEHQLHQAASLLARRCDREPIAYIVGHKEFYGRDFAVNHSVLIPRPETEELINLLRTTNPHAGQRMLDVGTGSGCIGLTAALETPGLHVTLSDISNDALRVARANSHAFGFASTRRFSSPVAPNTIALARSDLLGAFAVKPHLLPYDYIVSNLPYVDPSWQRSPETDHEPRLALFAGEHGIALIHQLLAQVPRLLQPGGYLLLEADPVQHLAICQAAEQQKLMMEKIEGYALLFVFG